MTEPLSLGFHAVAPGHLATVVTHLEMTELPVLKPVDGAGLSLRPMPRPRTDTYRTLFAAVGTEWLWQSRLAMDETDLRVILDDDRVQVFALEHSGCDAGLLELDFREGADVELAFFGLSAALQGTQAARWMMNQALQMVFARPLKRLWVHTCTLDHPRALAFYRRTGFRPYAQEIEVMRDPRIGGPLPRSAGPHIPVFE